MSINKVADSLHPLERKVLPLLARYYSINDIIEHSGLKYVEVMRAIQWLKNKDLITITEAAEDVLVLGETGSSYAANGLPEKRFLESLVDGTLVQKSVMEKAGIDSNEFNACIGILRNRNAIDIRKGASGLEISITAFGKKLLERGFLEEKLLKKQFPLPLSRLGDDDNLLVSELEKRHDIVRKESQSFRTISLNDSGRMAISLISEQDVVDRLTPQLLSEGSWKGKKFRRFDVTAQSPNVSPGRLNHYRAFLDFVKSKFLGLGFTEMSGPIVESDFWDMDVLFMPQFHSARDIHDAYYIKHPKLATDIPPLLLEKVKAAHENGFGTGSKGWRYKFDMKRTFRQLLRTQTTACSARMLASKDIKIPGKYFALSRVFRSDVIDATHLADFNQLEGIVVEEGLTFQHLVGLLKLFAKEIAGADEIKVSPTYFPFTEPSASLYAKHPQMGWIELGGSGIFRPEMMKPLGIDAPVIAWGIGIDRIAMFRLGLTDIRHLFSKDIRVLRESRMA